MLEWSLVTDLDSKNNWLKKLRYLKTLQHKKGIEHLRVIAVLLGKKTLKASTIV